MRIAIFHNRYRQTGGEDVAVDFEHRILESAGHQVMRVEFDNEEVFGGSKRATLCGKALTARRSRWNHDSERSIEEKLRKFEADIGHVHNWFPLISPSVYAAHHRFGIPVVQTLHNYRLGCASGTFWRNQEVCTDCLDGRRMRAIARGCYRSSRLQTMGWYHAVAHGWRSKVFRDQVDAYLAPSHAIRGLHIHMGISGHLIHHLPNAVDDPGASSWPIGQATAVFVGRLEPEKGVKDLVEVCDKKRIPLTVIGEGSLGESLRRQFGLSRYIRFLGQLPKGRVQHYIGQASVAVVPSLWMEPFGLGVIEAMAKGRPVVVTDVGGPSEIVQDGVQGIQVPAGDKAKLGEAIRTLVDDSERCRTMGRAARMRYLKHYTPEQHLTGLMRVFEGLINRRLGYVN